MVSQSVSNRSGLNLEMLSHLKRYLSSQILALTRALLLLLVAINVRVSGDLSQDFLSSSSIFNRA